MINYTDNIWLLCKYKGSVMPGAMLLSLPSTAFALSLCLREYWWPDLREDSGWAGLSFVGTTWNAMTAGISLLLGLRINQALGRFWEGTSLLHQMRGEWFDAASCLISFTREAKTTNNRGAEVDHFQDTLVRLMSLMHASALDEISDSPGVDYDVIDIYGLDKATLTFLSRCERNRVEALQHLIQVLVTENFHRGILSIPAPILSRVYQTLSRGFVNMLNARKIKDTMFPFPFVQTIKVLLLVHSFVTPVIMTSLLDSNQWSLLFTFVPLFALHSLNLTAWQLEMPFGLDYNDLPLADFQTEMNDTLLMFFREGADHCPCRSVESVNLREITSRDMPATATGNSRSINRLSFFTGINSGMGMKKSDASSSQSAWRSPKSDGSTSASVWPPVWHSPKSPLNTSNTKCFRHMLPSDARPSDNTSYLDFSLESDDANRAPAYKSDDNSSILNLGLSVRTSSESCTVDTSFSNATSLTSEQKLSFENNRYFAPVGRSPSLPTIYSLEVNHLRQISEGSVRASSPARMSTLEGKDLSAPGRQSTPETPERPRKVRTPKEGDSRALPPFSATRSRTHTPDFVEGSPKNVQLGQVGLDRPAEDETVSETIVQGNQSRSRQDTCFAEAPSLSATSKNSS